MTQASLTIVLAMLTMVGAMGIDTYLPAFHAIGADLHVEPMIVQQTLSIYVAFMAITMLLSGTLSDSFGRRRVLVVSMMGFTLTSIAAALAPNAQMLILVRALQGASAGASVVVGRAIVQDLFKGAEAQRVMATITMVFSVTPAVAPLLGGWLQSLSGWRSVFLFMATYGALLWFICQRKLPETLAPAQRVPFRLREVLGRYAQSLRHKGFVLMILSIALIFSGIPLYIGSAASFVMDVLGLPETSFGWLFIPLVAGTASGAWVSRRLSRSVAPAKMMRAGMAVMLAAAIVSVAYASFFAVKVPYAVLPLMLYTFGTGLVMPAMTLRALTVFPHMRGLAASMQSFMQMMGFSIVSAFIVPLVHNSAQLIAIAHLVTLLAGIVLWRIATNIHSGSPSSSAATATQPSAGPKQQEPV